MLIFNSCLSTEPIQLSSHGSYEKVESLQGK